MGNFRTNIILFVICLIVSILVLEFSGVRQEMGISWWGTFSIIPTWLAIPAILILVVAWILNPSSSSRR